MIEETGDILRNMHLKCSSPQYLVEQLDSIMKLLGYRPLEKEDVPGLEKAEFLVSMLTGGWISIYNDHFLAVEEVTRRLTQELGTRAFYLWAEAGVSWGYSYYLEGKLNDEFCSGIDELFTALFDSLPTSEERKRLMGEPAKLLDDFHIREVSVDYFNKLFSVEKSLSKGCMIKFAQIFGIQTAGRTFSSIWQLPDEEKFGRERFNHLCYVLGDEDSDDDEDGGESHEPQTSPS